MIRYYKDFYGNTATIGQTLSGDWIVCINLFGGIRKTCYTLRAAEKALRSISYGWREIDRVG